MTPEAMAEVMAPKLPIQNRSTISPRCKSPGARQIRAVFMCMQDYAGVMYHDVS